MQAKIVLGLVKCFSKFAKRIYETCNRNFFNLASIVVFSIIQLYYFFVLLA